MWEDIQLDVYQGGTAEVPVWTGAALTAGATVGLGEHIKLKINNQGASNIMSTFK